MGGGERSSSGAVIRTRLRQTMEIAPMTTMIQFLIAAIGLLWVVSLIISPVATIAVTAVVIVVSLVRPSIHHGRRRLH